MLQGIWWHRSLDNWMFLRTDFYLGRGVSLHSCSSKAQLLLLTLDEGYLLTAALPDLQRGMAPLSPPAPPQAPLLGREVAPPGRCPWPQARVGSSRRFLRCRSLALSAAAPDLGRGVTPLGHAWCAGLQQPVPSAPGSQLPTLGPHPCLTQ